ncbi:MAG: glutamate racemase [Elusimicrobia bacterium]|nr:glutamate racemase [Elusimicrobiota bacterium]
MQRADRPIGIFDSGVGGLTVFRAVQKKLPGENLIYYGDTAHLPYGSKSAEAVKKFSLKIGKFLEREGIKLLVVACNTASSVVIPLLRRTLAVPVLGVIEPGAWVASRATRAGRIGVIGTEATIASGAYLKALRSYPGRFRILSVPCPLFVPLVEEGFWNGNVTREIARKYLAPIKKWRADTLILGCTHYPFLREVISKTMGPGVVLVDSGEATALRVSQILTQRGWTKRDGRGRYRFYASDASERFKRLARRLLGVTVDRVVIKRFD